MYDLTKYIDDIELKFRGDENKWLRVAMKLQTDLETCLDLIEKSKRPESITKFNNKRFEEHMKNSMYYSYDEPYAEPFDYVTPEQTKLENITYWVQSVVERLYDTEQKIDIFSLECDLDELCHLVGVKFKPGAIQICAKNIESHQNEENLNIMTGN